MDDLYNMGAIPIIVAIVYGSMSVYKSVFGDKEKFVKIIPLIAMCLGAVLGVVAFYLVPGLIPAADVLTALFLGGCSGLASTGTHQILKIFSGKDDDSGSSGTTTTTDSSSNDNDK